MDRPPAFAATIHKTDAVRQLMAQSGMAARDFGLSEAVAIMAEVATILPAASNQDIAFVPAHEVADMRVIPIEDAVVRPITPPVHTSLRPDSFPASGVEVLHSPAYLVLSVRDGMAMNFAETPVAFAADRRAIADWGGAFRGLLHYYDASAADIIRDATRIDGVALLMFDDIRPLNFCHWLIDWLPRLAALRTRPEWADAYVITTPIIAEFQRESLNLCGFPDDRIIELGDYEAVSVRELLVPSDLSDIPHPGHKMAPWALHFLRETIGAAVMADFGIQKQDRRLYISRNDATGRRITNEDALIARLEQAGYEVVLATNMTFSQQVATFASASHLIGPHGAGLTNLVFSAMGVQLIELLPVTYGMPTFYAMTGGLDGRFYSFVTTEIVAGAWSQRDDLTIDMDLFEQVCGRFL